MKEEQREENLSIFIRPIINKQFAIQLNIQ